MLCIILFLIALAGFVTKNAVVATMISEVFCSMLVLKFTKMLVEMLIVELIFNCC